MSQSNRYEQEFLTKLKAVFIGAQVEGDSGFINLMRIKARYFEEGVFPQLRKDVDAACTPFAPGFREELFEKLYDFFSRYFSESGSIYFRHTAPHQSVYERIYTDDRDVMLFWKTHMLYYVKTDRLFNSMAVTVDGQRFFFDVIGLEHKRANEKRELLYTFKRLDADDQLVFAVAYSEKGSKTKLDDVLKAVKQSGGVLDEATLTQACRVFEKQSEVDYFINKNARAFLREQFDLWLYQYLFKGESSFDATRLRQLQAIQGIAYKIIDFIAQFEDELVRIWNKPKFVRNSHYVITLDKLRSEDNALLQRLFAHAGMAAQLAEWRALGMVDDASADAAALLDKLAQRDLTGAPVHPHLHFLPLDTRYFPDLELEILATFDDLDAALDGWLVHSENYQALVTLLPKFRGRVSCVHIDPPYNTSSSGFYYENQFAHASWLSMMFDRVMQCKLMLRQFGIFVCHIDENEFERLNLVLDVTGLQGAGVMIWDRGQPVTGAYGLATQHEYVVWRTIGNLKIRLHKRNVELIKATAKRLLEKYGSNTPDAVKDYRSWLKNHNGLSAGEKTFDSFDSDGRPYRSDNMSATDRRIDRKFYRPLDHPITKQPCPVPSFGWRYTPETIDELLAKQEILFGEDHTRLPRKKTFLHDSESSQLPSMYRSGARGKGLLDDLGLEFPFAHSLDFYEYILRASAPAEKDLVLDFFAGSGTTAHAVMNLNRADNGRRKYILVEMGEHFHSVILPRVKKVAFSDKWKNGKPVLSKAEGAVAGGQGMSHFVKYYDLEQYEETLRRASYADAPLFTAGGDAYTSYVFLRDLKLLDAVTVDLEQNTVAVDLSKLYQDIDLAETLSCLTGKQIKRITPDTVEFADGSAASLRAPDWATIKPLIWW